MRFKFVTVFLAAFCTFSFAQDPYLISALEQYFLNKDLESVTEENLGADSVSSAKIQDNAVGASELADSAVDTAALQDGAVTTPKLADGSVTSAKLAGLGVGDVPTLPPTQITGEALTKGTVFSGDIAGTWNSMSISVPYVSSESDPTVPVGPTGAWTQKVLGAGGLPITNVFYLNRGVVTNVSTNSVLVF